VLRWWVINFTVVNPFPYLFQYAREGNSVSVHRKASCAPPASLGHRLTPISLAATDIVLLLTMLTGLFRLRYDGYGTFGLACLLWKQV
jgi:hypothetical protein